MKKQFKKNLIKLNIIKIKNKNLLYLRKKKHLKKNCL